MAAKPTTVAKGEAAGKAAVLPYGPSVDDHGPATVGQMAVDETEVVGTDATSQQIWRHVWQVSGLLRWLVLSILLIFLGLFVFACTQSAIVATEWFSGLIAAFAFLAFGAATVTVILALPAFRTWLQRPKLVFTVKIIDQGEGEHELLDGGEVIVSGLEFTAIMLVTNRGDAPCIVGVNVCVRSSCSMASRNKLEIRPDPEPRHLRIHEKEACTVATARTDNMVPAIPLVYSAAVKTPAIGQWPISLSVFTSVQNLQTGKVEQVSHTLRGEVTTATL